MTNYALPTDDSEINRIWIWVTFGYGTGGGLPGIPLAIVCHETSFTPYPIRLYLARITF
jgi:hypothetical protein